MLMKSRLESIGEEVIGQRMAEGKARGKAEGRAEGKAEGKAEALVSLLVKRFGALGPSFRKRIRGATLAAIERWLDRAVDAPNVSSVFGRTR